MQLIIFFTGLSKIWQGIWREDESKHQLSLLCTCKTQRHDTARQMGCHHSSLLCLLWIRSVTVNDDCNCENTQTGAGSRTRGECKISSQRSSVRIELICGKLGHLMHFDEGREKYIMTFWYKMRLEVKSAFPVSSTATM